MFDEYIYKTELHAHTKPVSLCADLESEDVIKIYKNQGYSSIVITNHFNPDGLETNKEEYVNHYLSGYYESKKFGEQYGLRVILGCELRFTENDNDYLIFGIVDKDLFTIYDYLDKGIKTFYKEFKDEKRVIIQAHPFRNGVTLAPVDSLDGIESFNMHPGHNSRVAFSSRHTLLNNLIATCGTDYHHLGHEGVAALLSKEEIKDSFQLAQILKSKKYLFNIGESIVLPYGKNQIL